MTQPTPGCPQSEVERKSAWYQGYWDGLELEDNQNPFPKDTPLWRLYEEGYEEGWLDS